MTISCRARQCPRGANVSAAKAQSEAIGSAARSFFLLIALLLGACAAPHDTAHRVIISTREQRLALIENDHLVATYPVSTSKFGLGDWRGSYRTPLGKLVVADKIGNGAPLGAVFKDRRRTGEVVGIDAPGRDPI